MAFAFRINLGSFGAFGGGTSWDTTVATAINSGDLLIVALATDNLDTSDGQSSTVTGVTIGGQSLSKIREYTNGNGSAGAGAVCSLWYFQNSSAQGGGAAAHVDFAGSLGTNGAQARAYAFTMDNAKTLTEAGFQVFAADASTDLGDLTISGLLSQEYLFLRLAGCENASLGTTPTTGWTLLSGSSNGTIGIMGERRITTTTGDTSTIDNAAGANDSASVMVALSEGPPGGIVPSAPAQEIGRLRSRNRMRR